MIRRNEHGALVYELRIPSRGMVDFLRDPARWESRALFGIGEALFEFESFTKDGPEYQLQLDLEPIVTSSELNRTLGAILERLIAYVLLLDTQVVIGSREPRREKGEAPAEKVRESDAICLFSGGIDSWSGILRARQRYPQTVAAFCAHANQGRTVSVVRRLSMQTFPRFDIELVEVPAPEVRIAGYSQLRGVFYILAGAAIAVARNASKVVVSECGPTMYQPRFSPIDQVTMTTHPFVVARASEMIDCITSGRVRVETLFENTTKAEVMAVSAEKGMLPHTHSCISQRLKLQDGTCFGCVVRRLAAVAADVPDSPYARDPIIEEEANASNLLALLDFCSGILLAPDQLPWYQRELIDEYQKWDLFQRFALDNFTALHGLRRKGVRLSAAVAGVYEDVVAGLGGPTRLDERMGVLKALDMRSAIELGTPL